MIKKWFYGFLLFLKEKWKDILFIVISMILVISGIALYKYLNERDIANISNDENNEILYKSDLNNIFGYDWYDATFYLGKWSINSSIDDFTTTRLLSDDLSSNTDDFGTYYFNMFNPIESWKNNVNTIYSVNDFPYFEIVYNGSYCPTYQFLNLYFNNLTFASNLYVDYNLVSPNGANVLILSQQLQDRYLIMNNVEYYNYEVSFIRFRSGVSISSDSSENDFISRFGSSLTYTPYIQLTNGIDAATYEYLQNQYDALNTQFNALNSAYNNLNNRYTTLEQNYSILLEQYNSLLNQSDYSFSELFWSISAVPFNVIKSGFNVNILGANIGSIITGLFTAAIVIWLFKKLFK